MIHPLLNIQRQKSRLTQILCLGVILVAGDGCGGEIVISGHASLDSRLFKGHRFTKIKAQESWNLALRDDGATLSWGQLPAGDSPGMAPRGLSPDRDTVLVSGGNRLFINEKGEIEGLGEEAIRAAKLIPQIEGKVVHLAKGGENYAAVDDKGKVHCWGTNVHGECEVPADLGPVAEVACGDTHTLALLKDGTVRSWGGKKPPIGSEVLDDLRDVVQIGAQGYFGSTSVALQRDGTIVVWGNPRMREMVPRDNFHAKQIVCGWGYVGALLQDGTVRVWGDAENPITQVPNGLGKVTALAGGDQHCLALQEDGKIVAWGSNYFGEGMVPSILSGATQIAADDRYIFVAVPGHPVYCWGFMRTSLTFELLGTENAAHLGFTPGCVAGHTAGGKNFLKLLNEAPQPGDMKKISALGKLSSATSRTALTTDGQCHFLSDLDSEKQIPHNATDLIQVENLRSAFIGLRKNGELIGWGIDHQSCLYFHQNMPSVASFCMGDDGHVVAVMRDGKIKIWGAQDNCFYQNTILNRLAPIKMADAVIGATAFLTAEGRVAVISGPNQPLEHIPPEVGKIQSIALGGAYVTSICMLVD